MRIRRQGDRVEFYAQTVGGGEITLLFPIAEAAGVARELLEGFARDLRAAIRREAVGCETCGKTFRSSATRGFRSRFCSRKCQPNRRRDYHRKDAP